MERNDVTVTLSINERLTQSAEMANPMQCYVSTVHLPSHTITTASLLIPLCSFVCVTVCDLIPSSCG